jgi:hypothetical protein
MKQMSLTTIAIGASTFACAALLSFNWSEQRGVSLSIESAQARVGRPATPMSAAGVARRQTRRAVYGAGAVGAGAAAVGTAAAIGTAGAVAATSPNWGWGGNPYGWGGNPYQTGTAAAVGTAAAIGTAGAVAATSPNWGWGGNPYQTGTGYYGGGPYVGGPVRGARAAYPSAAWGGVSSGDRDLHIRNLRDSGYDKKKDFNATGTIVTQ